MRGILLGLLGMVAVGQVGRGVEIRVVYDNTSARADVQEDWGFAAVVSVGERRILFDSGTKPGLFLENLKKVGVEAKSIEKVIISHQHQDHRNGIYALHPLNPGMAIHFLKTFEPAAWTAAEKIAMKPVAIGDGPVELLPGVWTTGRVAGEPDEQALVVETPKGIVVMVGCSHPGVVKMVEAAEQQRGKDFVRLLLGGFHMFRQDAAQIGAQILELRRQKVQQIRPAHCTGELAHSLFEKEWGASYGKAGAGNVIRVD